MENFEFFEGVIRVALFCGTFYSGWLAYGSPEGRPAGRQWLLDLTILFGLMTTVYVLASVGPHKIILTASIVAIVAFNLGRWRGARNPEGREPSAGLLADPANVRR